MNLSKFLVQAKTATYASEDKANETVLEDGAKELIFEGNGFRYRDRYYGFNPFFGEEIVWQNYKIVWSMNYFGKISSDLIPEKKVYIFLREAMRQVEEDRPFRGPHKFKSGNFEYLDESKGNIHSFTGIERIFYNGEEIYRLYYHGGSV